MVNIFADSGGQAIETNYPYDINIKNVTSEISIQKNLLAKQLVKEKGLLETGGSDFHGIIRKSFTGQFGVSSEIFQKLKRLSEDG